MKIKYAFHVIVLSAAFPLLSMQPSLGGKSFTRDQALSIVQKCSSAAIKTASYVAPFFMLSYAEATEAEALRGPQQPLSPAQINELILTITIPVGAVALCVAGTCLLRRYKDSIRNSVCCKSSGETEKLVV